MQSRWALHAGAAVLLLLALGSLRARLRLSKAKHPSLSGHGRLARALAALIPYYGYGEDAFFRSDGAPEDVSSRRRSGFERLARTLRERSPRTIEASAALESGLSDLAFTAMYRVPFQFREHVVRHLPVGALLEESAGNQVRDLDGTSAYDVTGSYGVNVFGYDFYKDCIAAGSVRVAALGPVLGAYHPIIVDNVERLKAVSGLDEVSFHMSGTEAVMQAVRLARFHTRKSHLVLFCGAYHGWWDGVQPGLGSRRRSDDVYVLKEMSPDTLAVLASRDDIACVLVNPLQGLHPNASAPGDAGLVDSSRRAGFDRSAYRRWLEALRRVCSERSIVLIFDEVFVGFRIARGGAQEYFGVRADMVTYGKTLGGGLPVGAVCGKAELMKRFRADRPGDVCFARGTFNSHPYVMAAMNEFLSRLDTHDVAEQYRLGDDLWNSRAETLNARLAAAQLPVRVANLVSIFTILYQTPSRYNWMLQYYLRAHGLALSWVGSGRLIFSHDYSDSDFAEVVERIVRAAAEMQADGWWWCDAALSNRAIKRLILRQVLAARFGVRPPAGNGAQPATSSSPSVSSSDS